jgi:phosphatidylserine decarboxylase
VSRRTLREGRRYLLVAAAVEAALLPLRRVKGRLLLGVTLGCLVFFRDPERALDPEPDTLYAPADGIVTAVDTVQDAWVTPGEALRISTFLSITDVHVNRSPAGGVISQAAEAPGGFAPAFLGRARANHRKRLAIEDGPRRVVLEQFAGMLARRISSWAWLGDRVQAGERIALIHLGSRADVLVPAADARPLVSVGQRVRAGVTPIARYRDAEAA